MNLKYGKFLKIWDNMRILFYQDYNSLFQKQYNAVSQYR